MSRLQDERKKEKGKRTKMSISSAPRRGPGVGLFAFLLFTFSLVLEFHITNIDGFKSLQELHRFVVFEFRILRFDHQKETVTRSQRKVWGVEYRMIRLWQLIQRQHPEYRCKGCRQHRAFKRNRNERRPTIEWFAADIDGIVDHFHPVLHEKP